MTYGEPMGMPNEAGWWAFEGKRYSDIAEELQVATEVFIDDGLNRLVAKLGSFGIYDVNKMCGKWYRVYMPWEQQPAPSVPEGYVTLHEYKLNRRIANAFDMGVEVDRQRINEVRERLGIKPLAPTASVPDGVREAIQGMMYYLDNELDETHVGELVATVKTWLNEQEGG